MIVDSLNIILSFILVISLLVFVHEFGHYYVAKKCGVKVEVFSIGFGKELFSMRDKNDTLWKICLIPLGGYVKMFGDSNASSTPDYKSISHFNDQERKIAFYTQPVLKRMAIVIAGPLANYLLAITIISFFLIIQGKAYIDPVVSHVVVGGAAETSGVQVGDRILELNGTKIDDFSQIPIVLDMVQGDEVSLKVSREGKIQDFLIATKKEIRQGLGGEEVKRRYIGVAATEFTFQKIAFYKAPILALESVYDTSLMTLKYLKQILIGKRDTSELGGVIRIAKYSGEASKHGVYYFLSFISLLSINLGLFNLLPIPLLDGGHLFFYCIELLSGKRIPEKIQQFAFKIGFVILMLIFIIATFNDIKILI